MSSSTTASVTFPNTNSRGDPEPPQAHETAGQEVALRSVSGDGKPTKAFDADYDLQETVLGVGIQSVKEAICRTTGKSVAVKAFPKQVMEDDCLKRMREEVELLRQMSHPGVVRLQAVYESPTDLHIVMERLTGGELWARLLGQGCSAFEEPEAAEVATQVLRTVAHLHACGVVHLDIKLENLVYGQPQGRALKLIDFGFATSWAPGQMLKGPRGTIGYVAPEVCLDHGYDAKADVWSVGSVVYHLLTQKAPFEGNEHVQLRKNRRGAVDYSKEFRQLSAEAQDFVTSLFQPRPCRRPTAKQALQHAWLLRRRLGGKTSAGSEEVEAEVIWWEEGVAEEQPSRPTHATAPIAAAAALSFVQLGVRTVVPVSRFGVVWGLGKLLLGLKPLGQQPQRVPSDDCSPSVGRYLPEPHFGALAPLSLGIRVARVLLVGAAALWTTWDRALLGSSWVSLLWACIRGA